MTVMVIDLDRWRRRFLVTDRPSYLGGMVNILAGSWTWTGYPRLAEAVVRGGTILDQHAETPGHEFWETFAPSSTGIAAPAAQALALRPSGISKKRKASIIPGQHHWRRSKNRRKYGRMESLQ
jgi:hypothetical protein